MFRRDVPDVVLHTLIVMGRRIENMGQRSNVIFAQIVGKRCVKGLSAHFIVDDILRLSSLLSLYCIMK